MLNATGISISFGGLRALDGVSLTAATGEVTGVIGPNGAGKTTFFNCISGLYTPDAGAITFQGHPMRGSVVARARRGLGRTFQNPRLFASLSVLDNLMLGCAAAESAGRTYRFEPSPRAACTARSGPNGSPGWSATGATWPCPASGLAFGDLRVVELARALCGAPTLLMLDEPASGLDIEQADDLVNLMRRLADLGLAVLLIEHDMAVVMGVCDTITVLNFGTVLPSGTPEAVQADEAVIEAYLGSGM